MAEEMDAVRTNEDRTNDTPQSEQATTTASPQKETSTATNGGGLRNKINKSTPKENTGTNLATTAEAPKTNEATKTTAPQEKEARTKSDDDEAQTPATTTDTDEASSDDDEAQTPATVAAINTATPQSVTWKELREMMNEKSVLQTSFKSQLSPTFFNTVATSSNATKDEALKNLENLKAQDAQFGSAPAFTDKQTALREMLNTNSQLAQQVQSLLASSTNENQKIALEAYLATIQNYSATLQRKIENNQTTWDFFFGPTAQNNDLQTLLQSDKDFADKFLAFAKSQNNDASLEAFLALQQNITPKKFLFELLLKGVKDDAASIDNLLKTPNNITKKSNFNLPNNVVVDMLQAYKGQKMGQVKKGMKGAAHKALADDAGRMFAQFSASNPTADQL